MPAPPGLVYRDDLATPDARAEVYRLVYDIFGVDVAPLQALNLWDPTYRSFSYLDGSGTCVANAATCQLKLNIEGRPVIATDIQSVATRPAWRGQGLSRDLLDRALRWCHVQAPLTFLMTSIPLFYEPLGFRPVPQCAFVGAAPTDIPPASPCRRLDRHSARDQQLLAGLLRSRAPISQRFSIDAGPGTFLLNLLGQPDLAAWHMSVHDALVVTAEREDDVLCVVDVVAQEIPDMPAVVATLGAALGAAPGSIEVHFPPDALGWTGTPVARHGETQLMVRGDPGLLPPLMLPETGEF